MEGSAYPTIAEVRQMAKARKLKRCVVVFQLPDGRLGYTSYGETKALCEDTRAMMDSVFDRLEKWATLPPFQFGQ